MFRVLQNQNKAGNSLQLFYNFLKFYMDIWANCLSF